MIDSRVVKLGNTYLLDQKKSKCSVLGLNEHINQEVFFVESHHASCTLTLEFPRHNVHPHLPNAAAHLTSSCSWHGWSVGWVSPGSPQLGMDRLWTDRLKSSTSFGMYCHVTFGGSATWTVQCPVDRLSGRSDHLQQGTSSYQHSVPSLNKIKLGL